MQCCQVRETKALSVKLYATPSLGQIPFTACICFITETVISENTACLPCVLTCFGWLVSPPITVIAVW